MQSFRHCGNNASICEERQLVHVCKHQGRKAKQLRKCESTFTAVINEDIARVERSCEERDSHEWGSKQRLSLSWVFPRIMKSLENEEIEM